MSSSSVVPASTSASAAMLERYQLKTQREHVLLRPETYAGSMEPETRTMWVLGANDVFEKREVVFVPALYKIFDEIVVNAADRKQVHPKLVHTIRVDVDPATSMIAVYNDGPGIPVEMHPTHKMYIPDMIFNHFLTGENYDDTEKRTTGGRNGFGAKLTNVFSTFFKIETVDATTRRKFSQVTRNNMETVEPFLIEEKWKG